MTMNGLLHTFSTTAVNNVSAVPLFWPGLGAINQEGVSYANPVLNCGTTYPQSGCFFGSAQNGGVQYRYGAGNPFVAYKHFLYTRGTVITRTDSSTKYIRMGAGTVDTPNNNPFGEPWSRWEDPETGIPTGNYYLCASGGQNYPCFFSPEREQ